MEFIISFFIVFIFALLLNQPIKRNRRFFYIFAIVMSVIAYIYDDLYNFGLITRGYIGLAFIIVVMYTGVLNSRSMYAKKLKRIRTELSIIGFIFISSHAWFYLFMEFKWHWFFGVVTYIIMIPLFITSFQSFKLVLGKNWMLLHKLSYLAYFTLFIHLFIATTEVDRKLFYGFLFGVYTVYRIYRYLERKKPSN